jgi:xanthine dehydrogenase YagR molybdenum-binding subunit
MAKTAWPSPDRRKYIGSRTSRLDGPNKVSGRHIYAYDTNRPNMIYARCVQSKEANAKIVAVDTSAAEALKGVLGVVVEKDRQGNLPTITYAGDIVCTVAAETEEIANEAAKLVKITYEVSPCLVDDSDQSNISGRDQARDGGDAAAAFAEAEATVEDDYSIQMITHSCHESHGQVCEFGADGDLYIWPSTQSVSQYAAGVRDAAELPAERIHVDCQGSGGGFGSKFAADRWGSIAVELAKMTKRPVKLMLERDQELKVAGNRPSAFAKIKVGVMKDGTIKAWDSVCWGTSGVQRFRMPPLPYVFDGVENFKTLGQGVETNRGPSRAWRAPNHPQGCFLTMSALEDAAAAIGMDPVTFFKKNLNLVGELAETYSEELDICAELIGYKDKWHPRGDKAEGPVKRGIGVSLHEWGGRGHPSACDVTINPDGNVKVQSGTQDLGTGTRTALAIVVADTLGIPMERITVEIGKNAYPASGASGGSTTIGGISASSRDAATQALNALLAKAAPELGVQAETLEAWDGKIQEAGKPSNAMTWEQACKLMGQMPITKQGSNPTSDGTELTTGGVGGVQMAEVEVDIETGVVRMLNFAAVQDIGLIIDMKTTESQVYGAMIMGVTSALYEETIYDKTTGQLLNGDLEYYRLATLGDIGTFKVHMMTGPKQDARGVIGLGEPPMVSPVAAISNAIANAVGVRCGHAPFTPDRVLAALEKGGLV